MRRENEFRYLKLANILREQILSGFIKPGEFLMSENELCKYYGMSRTSVRKSLEQLLQEGLIVKKVGQGTIVSNDVVPNPTQNKVLRIFAISPSHFHDIGMPIIVEEFQKENPNVEVKFLPLAASDYWDSVDTSKELGLQPDLLYIYDRPYALIEDFQQFADMEVPSGEDFAPLYPRLLNAFSPEGRLKAMPVTFSTVFLAYNPELFRQYGVPEPTESWTKEDFLRTAKRLTMDTNGDGIPDIYGLSLPISLSRWPVIALQNGINFKAPDLGLLTGTFRFLHELLYIHRVALLSPRDVLNSEAFIRGKAAMVLTTSIEIAGWANQEMRFAPKVAPLPFGDRKDTMLIANSFMIPRDSSEPELARQFVQKAIQPAVQEKISRNTEFISVLPSVNEAIRSPALLKSLHIHRDVIANSYFSHELFRDVNLFDEMEAEMFLYWAGLYSADEIARHMQRILSGQAD
ncbi:extracellular solute-binding protein [Cohnella zeiphila]|uniref:Extracellular solute-binding protein n=1 Tax=Cohnella zeiphila TaxID=2761120 RepID=A0A7X0VXU2_9BACL|nr:extracellular solute-binding protein [Cohnella zeiphila]MBB6734316.1 extracellular solute-binding protein [Cohnella zeiphila]